MRGDWIGPHLCGLRWQNGSQDKPCCNPECGGKWGAGCYCCHGERDERPELRAELAQVKAERDRYKAERDRYKAVYEIDRWSHLRKALAGEE